MPDKRAKSVGLNWLLHCLPGNMAAKRLNRDRTFTNRDDDLDGLKTQLDRRFDGAQLDVVGAVGILCSHLTRAVGPFSWAACPPPSH